MVDAKTNADLTQVTLAQIILESRGAARLLPVPLLAQLIRMGDDALAEFFQRYVGWALQVYVQLKQNARTLGVLNPFGNVGFGMPSGFGSPYGAAPRRPPPPRRRSSLRPRPKVSAGTMWRSFAGSSRSSRRRCGSARPGGRRSDPAGNGAVHKKYLTRL